MYALFLSQTINNSQKMQKNIQRIECCTWCGNGSFSRHPKKITKLKFTDIKLHSLKKNH